GNGSGYTVWRHGGLRHALEGIESGRDSGPNGCPVVADRPDQRRPLRSRQLVTASNCGLSKHQRPNGHDIRSSSRDIVLQHSLQRTNIDQANIWFRGGDTRKASAPVPPDATLLRAKSNSRPSPPTDQTHSRPTGKSPVAQNGANDSGESFVPSIFFSA